MKRRRLLLSLGLMLLTILIAGCSNNNQPATNVPTTPTPAATSTPNTINIQSFAFSPSTLTINKGDMVTWVNLDSVAHTVTSASFDSGSLAKGQSYNFTFNQVGIFTYNCTVHPSMQGVVIVK